MQKNTEVSLDTEFFDMIAEDIQNERQEATKDKLTNLRTVTPERVEWLWKPYIPRGKVTLMTADPGTGKTYFSLYTAAIVSNGQPFFGQETGRPAETVVFQNAEDGLADTILPRLLKIRPEANLDNVFSYDETEGVLDFSKVEEIETIMREQKPALMVFDPIQAYLAPGIDMHRANDVRQCIAPIVHLAERYNCAVLLIMHNSKMSGVDAMYRALGSIDFVGIARSMLIMGKHPEDPEKRVICHEKSSLARPGKSIVFHIDPDEGGIVFDEFTDLTANDVLNAKKKARNKPSAKLDEAVELLEELLGEDGWTELSKVKELDINERTMRRARKELELHTVMIGFGDKRSTYWLSPDIDVEQFKKERLFDGAEVILDNDESLFGNNDTSQPPF